MSEEEQQQMNDVVDFDEVLPLDASASVGVSVEAEALKFCMAANQYFASPPNAILNSNAVSVITECMSEYISLRAQSVIEEDE